MSFQTFVTERLKSITETLNAIGTNAKKIDELPVQSTLDPTSKIHVSKSGTSESLSVQKIIDHLVEKNYTRILEIGEISVSGLTISIPANAMWVYEGVNHQTVAVTEILETLCDTGFLRKDILVANQSNQIILIKGAESETIRIMPNIPIGTVLVTEIDVDDAVIGTPSTPILNGDYIPKIDKSHVLLQSSGVLDFYSFAKAKYNGIVLDGTYTSFGGVSYVANSSSLFTGRKLTIRNNQSTAINLLHNSSLAAVKFMFPNLVDFVIKPKEVIEFIYRANTNASGWYDYVGNINDIPTVEVADVVGLPAALDLKLDASSYNQHFKGVYLTEAALIAAHPTGVAGDAAQVNEVGATDVINYSWDAEESIWVNNGTGGSGAVNTDALPEGSTNLYWTVARFLANLTYPNVIAALGFTPSTAPNDAQKNSEITKAEIEAKLTGEISTHTHERTDVISLSMSDSTTALVTGDTDPMNAPYNFTLVNYWIGAKTAPTISSLMVDVKKNGVSITSTKAGIDATEKTSLTGTTPVLTTTSFTKGDEITPNIYQIGSGETGKALKLYLEIIKT
jgi:hypothetical protein